MFLIVSSFLSSSLPLSTAELAVTGWVRSRRESTSQLYPFGWVHVALKGKGRQIINEWTYSSQDIGCLLAAYSCHWPYAWSI